jgi:hypothetical protein
MKDSKTPFYCSKVAWARERIFPNIIENLYTRSQKVRQPGPSLDGRGWLKDATDWHICIIK